VSVIAAWRDVELARLARELFDILIIGGGITGAGVARDAALRGLRVALCEKDDFASGTSSRSSRLIHGGVRYLEHGHLHLVFESSRERRTLQRIAPHLVRPLAFTWPVYRGARVRRWKLLAGLTLYDALALFRNSQNHRRLSRDGVKRAEPALTADGLTGGARYWDAATDDSRLTLANALGAAQAGAVVLNHAPVIRLIVQGGRANGAVVHDTATGQEVAVHARCVISASGPWTDTVLGRQHAEVAPSIRGVAGAHIAVPRNRVANRDAITVTAPQDGRVMFVLPSGNQTIIGTTETRAASGPDDIRATREEVRYLLDACNAYFPAALLRDADVIAAWSGIRPLAAAVAAGAAASASREHTIAENDVGVLVVTGGKLTTYRAMAEQVVDRVVRSLGGQEFAACTSADVPLPGGDLSSVEAMEREAVEAIGVEERGHGLVRRHGSVWRTVWELERANPALAEPIESTLPYTLAEAVYAVGHERACTLGDLLIRRTRVAFESRDHGAEGARRIAAALAARLGWDPETRAKALDEYEKEVGRVFGIDG
jgi:glycerol-3-phosphate dehydrogenase